MIRVVLSLVLLLVFTGVVFVRKYILSGPGEALEYVLSHFVLAAGLSFLMIWPLNLLKKYHSSVFSVIFYIMLVLTIQLLGREIFLMKTKIVNMKHGLAIKTSIGTFSFGVVENGNKNYRINNAVFFSDGFVIYAPIAEISQNILSMQQGTCFVWSNNIAFNPRKLTNNLSIPLSFDMERFYRSWNLDASSGVPIFYLLWDKEILFNPYMAPFRKNWLLTLMGDIADLLFLMLAGALGIAYGNKLSWRGIKCIGCGAFYAVLVPAVVLLYDYLILLSNVIANIWL